MAPPGATFPGWGVSLTSLQPIGNMFVIDARSTPLKACREPEVTDLVLFSVSLQAMYGGLQA